MKNPLPFPLAIGKKLLNALQWTEKTEGGIRTALFCNLIKCLYLTLNSNKNKDLDSLVSLLFARFYCLDYPF